MFSQRRRNSYQTTKHECKPWKVEQGSKTAVKLVNREVLT